MMLQIKHNFSEVRFTRRAFKYLWYARYRKTTMLQTIIMSLAVSHTPEEVNFYVIDFGRMFLDFRDLPHIGGIIQEGEMRK